MLVKPAASNTPAELPPHRLLPCKYITSRKTAMQNVTATTSHPSRASTGSISQNDGAKLVLRVGLAVLVLFHGLAKVAGGVGFISGMLAQAGLPAVLAYGVYVGEVIAPLLVLIGLFTRPAALIIAINMVVAILMVHTGELFSLSKTGGWALELQGFFLLTAIVVAMQGAGRYSVSRGIGKWN